MITTVLLDVDNTLLDFNRCAAGAMKSAFAEWDLAYEDRVLPAFHEINDQLWEQIEQGRLTKDTLHQVRWQKIFDRLGIRRSGADFEITFLKYMAESYQPVEGAGRLLEYLYPKYTLCIVSNASHHQQMNRLEKAGFLKYFKYVFTSEQIGCPKPGRKFFSACLSQLGDPPKESVIIIGDSLSADIRGGRESGIQTCWYHHSGAAAEQNDAADYTVGTLAEIEQIL